MKTKVSLALLSCFCLAESSWAQPPSREYLVSVSDFGAVGNDDLPDDGTIRRAMNAVRDGGEVHFPPGVFEVSAQIVVKSDIRLVGHNTTIRAAKSIGGVLIIDEGAENVEIVGLRIEAPQCSFGLKATRANRVTIRDCKFFGRIERGFLIDFDGAVTDSRIEACFFTDTMHGIRLRGPVERATINGCEFTNWLHYGVYLIADEATGPQMVTISDNKFHSPKRGKGGARQMIAAYPDPEKLVVSMSRLRVLNNTCTGPREPYDRESETSRGTADQISIHYTSDFEISGNISEGGGENGIVATNFCTRGIVSNNIVTANDGHGIQISSLNERASDILITGNICTNNGLRAAGRRDSIAGIYVQDAERIAIHANHVVDNRTPRKQWAGILIASSENIDLGPDNTVQFADTDGYHAAAVFDSSLAEPLKIYHPRNRNDKQSAPEKTEK